MRRALILILTACVSVASAADKPDFSGEWTLNVAKSTYGQLPPPQSFIRKIEHKEPAITIVEEQTGPGTTPTSTRTMKTDGKTVEVDMNGAPVKLTATWEGATLLATTIEAFGVLFNDKMSLSGDGKQLTSVVHVASPQGELDITIVFDRK